MNDCDRQHQHSLNNDSLADGENVMEEKGRDRYDNANPHGKVMLKSLTVDGHTDKTYEDQTT